MAKMDEGKLKSILQAEKRAALGDAYGTADSDLSQQRAESMDYYQGDMDKYMPTAEGRSKALSTDVADTVDSLMPTLMDIFMGSDEVVRFAAVGAEDEEAALQETDYVNHCFFTENPGFTVLHSFIKDALIQKNGVVKYWWDEGDEEQRETYLNLTDDAFALLAAEETVEIIEHTEREGADEYGQPALLHDATVIARKPYGRVKVMAVPPEEFLIARDAISIQDSRYCAHVTKKTRSELIDDGYPKSVIDDLPTGTEILGIEDEARDTVNDNDDSTDGADVNHAMQKVEVTEHFIKVDYDDDGIAELRKVTTAGTGMEVLDNEPYDRMPFAGITPILMSHRFWGRAVADIVKEIQKINTALMRHMLDNIYYMNSQRLEIAESHMGDHTIDDVLTPRPGSPIRTKTPGGLNPIPTESIVQHVLPVIEHMHMVRETRTGVSRFNAGPNANSINPFNSTATGANIVATAGQQRIRLIARTFAETGIKDMFLGIHELILKHGKDARKVKLRNKWVTVDPRQWKTRKDMTVMVGLGTGTKDQIQQYLMQILEFQVQAIQMQGSASGPLVKLANVYNTLKKVVENAGYRDVDPFFTEPPENYQEPPKQDPKMAEVQGKLQLKQAEVQGNMQMKQAEMQADMQSEMQKAQMDAQLQRESNIADLNAKRQEAVMDAQIEVFKAQLKAETDKMVGGMKAQTDLIIGEMKAQLEAAVAMARPEKDVRSGGKVG